MFVSKHQIFIFIACLSFGAIYGIIYSFLSGIKFFIKNRIINGILDVLFCLSFGFLFVLYSYIMNFTNFRFYMFIGLMVGFILYLKSFHIILAKYCKKIYNIIYKKLGKFKQWKKKAKFLKKRQKGLS